VTTVTRRIPQVTSFCYQLTIYELSATLYHSIHTNEPECIVQEPRLRFFVGLIMADEIQDDEDLIGSMMGEEAQELHPSVPRGQVEDLVEAVWGKAAAAHDKNCEFIPYINPHGVVFCLSCGSTVSETNDISHCFCPKCACPNSAHLNGKCLMLVDGKPCPCSDGHEFRSTSFDTKTKEARQWLEKRKRQFARR
jgi:hypothetical protein